MIELHITMTGKSYKPDDEYRGFGDSRHEFHDLSEAKAWLDEQYGKCKRVPMYRDQVGGPPIKSGWIFCFNNSDLSHSPVSKWRQQDWVSFNECKPMDLSKGSN